MADSPDYEKAFLSYKKLLDEGANVNEEDAYSRTPIYYAAYVGNLKLVVEFIKQSANLNHRDKIGWTVLRKLKNSCYNDNKEKIKNFL